MKAKFKDASRSRDLQSVTKMLAEKNIKPRTPEREPPPPKKKKKKKKASSVCVHDKAESGDLDSTCYMNHRLYVPKHLVTGSMKTAFTDVIENFYDAIDEDGNEREDRNLYVEGWQYHKSLGMYSFCRGDDSLIAKYFGKFEIVDQRPVPPLKYRPKFLGAWVNDEHLPLRDSQIEVIKIIREKNYGIIKAPPRFGKTTVMSRLVTLYKTKTIVFVHQEDLAEQFMDEFRDTTDVREIEAHTGKPFIGIVRNWDDLAKLQVAIVCWQKIHAGKGGKAAIKKYKNSFGLTLIDEGHRFSSKFSSRIVAAFNTRYRIAVTATPERKDKRDVIIKQIVGPVTAIGKVEQVPMLVQPMFSGLNVKFNRWTTLVSKLSKSAKRNNMCVKHCVKRVKEGHSCLIVVSLKKHMDELAKRLTKEGVSVECFKGGIKKDVRKAMLRRASTRQTQVIIGMRQLMTGVNVKCWDTVYLMTPMSNLPEHYQIFSRVRTPDKGKEVCLVVDMIDNTGATRGCYRTRHQNYVNPEYGPVKFVDKNGMVYKKAPSLKQILEWSFLNSYCDVNEDATGKPATNGPGGRKPSGFQGSRPIWGWGNKHVKKGSVSKWA